MPGPQQTSQTLQVSGGYDNVSYVTNAGAAGGAGIMATSPALPAGHIEWSIIVGPTSVNVVVTIEWRDSGGTLKTTVIQGVKENAAVQPALFASGYLQAVAGDTLSVRAGAINAAAATVMTRRRV